MPPPTLTNVWKEWEKVHDAGTKGKTARWQCKHCKTELAENATTFDQHLQKCTIYLALCREKGVDNTVTTKAGSRSKIQPRISWNQMSDEKKESLDIESAMALYMGGLAFRTFHVV
jgi:hypothetical protein